MLAATGYILTLFSFGSDSVPAPVDTAHVVAKRAEHASIGRMVHDLRSPDYKQGMNKTLAENGFFIKQYGLSGSGTISRRGADPTQVQVLWNGLVVNNPLLGMADLGILSRCNGQSLKYIEGGNSSLYGSGSVGGTLSISDQAPDSALLIGVSALSGSFNQQGYSLYSSLKKKKSFVSFEAGLNSSRNDFRYKVPNAGSELLRMAEASTQSQFARTVLGTEMRNWHFQLNLEWMNNYRGLGTVAGSYNSNGEQYDQNLRTAAEIRYNGGNIKWIQRLGYFNDKIRYRNTLTGTDDTSSSQNFQYQSEVAFKIGRLRGIAGADLMMISGKAEAYGKIREVWYPAQFVSMVYTVGHWQFAANMRFEWKEKIPAAGVFAERKLNKGYTLKANVNNSFRRPTFNDLYWQPGGNSNLKYETGAGTEIGLNKSIQLDNLKIEQAVHVWARYLNRPIVWLPENNIWRAVNLEQSRYTGVQWAGKVLKKWKEHYAQLNSNLDFTKALALRNDAWYKQIFVPAFTGVFSVSAGDVKNELQLLYMHTGARYLTSDNSASLPAYGLVNAGFRRKFNWRKCGGLLGVTAENLMGTVYQNMPGRPMPLQSIVFNIQINVTK
jgi:iron complex outermembrane receptor protein